MTRRVLAVAVAALMAAVTASPALAHEGNPNYRSELAGITPETPGLQAEVLNYDDSLQLRNETGETVTVLGYEGEPYVRLDASGQVYVNTRSPAYYLNGDRYGEEEVPASADPEAEPEWEPVDGTGRYAWHDHRIHYMSPGTPNQVSDPRERTKIFDYRVPLEAGERRAAVTGTLYWVGEEDGGLPPAPFIALAAVALVAGIVLVVRRRPRHGDAEAW
jgi:hypothetical protein